MKTEIKEKWLNALKSGKYKQGIGLLKDQYGCYCVLGVLGEVCGLNIDKNGIDFIESDAKKAEFCPYPALLDFIDSETQVELYKKNDSPINVKADYSNVITFIESL